MAVTGKMTVDLYGNTHPFVQSMKAADDAAKKSGGSISASIEKINSKQMKNISAQILGGLGVIGMADAGAKMALEMIKGFKKGSENGLSGAMEIIGNSLIATIKSIPIAGTFFEIGKSIGEWASGVDAANESIARSNEQMKRTTDIVTKLKALQSPSTALTNQETKNANFGKSADVLAQEQARAEKQKQAKDVYDAQIINASKQTTDRIADYDAKAAQRKENTSRRVYNFNKEAKDRDEFKVKLGQQEENQFIAIKNQYDEQLKLADAEGEKLKASQEVGNQNNKNAEEKTKNKNDEIAAQSALDKLQLDAHQIGMDARDIELERLASMDGMTMAMLTQALAAWDQVEAAHQAKDLAAKNLVFRQDANKEALDGANDLAKARKDYADTEAELNAQAAGTSNVAGLSTAIGSIKVAGSTDFSIEKQMDIAKQQLNATELHTDILQEIADTLNAMGATT